MAATNTGDKMKNQMLISQFLNEIAIMIALGQGHKLAGIAGM